MPGIAGIIGHGPAEEYQRLAAAMVRSMQHEPFYRSGTYFVPQLGVYAGSTTLESSSAVDQVFFNERCDIALLLAGECFVDHDVRAALMRKGHDLGEAKNCLVHLYEEEGEQFVEKLNGLFTGLLIDKTHRKAFLFNDRYGSERIYWHQTDDAFYFASEAKALLRVAPGLREFDNEGVAQFLSFGCTFDWQTLFRGIRLLPGGSLWTFNEGRCKKRQYFYSRTWESLPALPPEEFHSAFEETFKRVLPRYFETNSRLGISLTGGLDTRMVMACRPQAVEKPLLYTFTGKDYETLDDRIAKKVAHACGLDHYLLRLGVDFFSDFASEADRTVYVTDGSFGVLGAHEIYLNKQAKELAAVRLTGVCGSEILRGISTFKPIGLCPALFNREFASMMSTAVDEFGSNGVHPVTFAAFRNAPWNLFGTIAASRSQVIFRTPYLDNEIVALAFQAPDSLRRSPLPALRLVENNSKSLRAIPTDRRIECKNAGLIGGLKRSVLEASFKLDYLHNEGMPDWLLPLDPVLERIDSKVRIFGHHKFLHYRSWFQRELADYVIEVMNDAQTRQGQFWNPGFLENMAKDHIRGRKNYTLELNALLTLEAVERLLFRGFSDKPEGYTPYTLKPTQASQREQSVGLEAEVTS